MKYLINHVSAKKLTAEQMIPSGTNSPPRRGMDPVIVIEMQIGYDTLGD
jgi:hypothetical protein